MVRTMTFIMFIYILKCFPIFCYPYLENDISVLKKRRVIPLKEITGRFYDNEIKNFRKNIHPQEMQYEDTTWDELRIAEIGDDIIEDNSIRWLHFGNENGMRVEIG